MCTHSVKAQVSESNNKVSVWWTLRDVDEEPYHVNGPQVKVFQGVPNSSWGNSLAIVHVT